MFFARPLISNLSDFPTTRRAILNSYVAANSKSRIVQIVPVNPASIAGVHLTALLTLTKLYHATHRLTAAL